jgi:hypothetical protein
LTQLHVEPLAASMPVLITIFIPCDTDKVFQSFTTLGQLISEFVVSEILV